MERFWINHPFIRWTVIALLLLAIVLEALAISNALAGGGPSEANDDPPSDPFGGGDLTPEQVTLDCTVLEWVNMREGPSVEFDPPLLQLPPSTPLTAIGRSGDVPWLQVRLEDGREGWVSSRTNSETLVQCAGDLGTLPEVGPEISAADVPEEPPPDEATITPQPSLRLREGNGPDMHSVRRTFDVALDGVLSEWVNVEAAQIGEVVFRPENWTGPEDLSGQAKSSWDDDFLYLAVQVADDTIIQESEEDLIVRGDAVEFFWDSDLQGDFDVDEYNEDEIQAVISPGNFTSRPPSSWVYTSPTGNFRNEISIAAQPTAIGYDIEIRIPWPRLNTLPVAGNVYGYALALSDDDSPGSGEQETQISTTPATPFRHPTLWGNFILDP